MSVVRKGIKLTFIRDQNTKTLIVISSSCIAESIWSSLGYWLILISTNEPLFLSACTEALAVGSVSTRIESFLVSCGCLMRACEEGTPSKCATLLLVFGAGRRLKWNPPTNSQLSSLAAYDSCVYLFYSLDAVSPFFITLLLFYSKGEIFLADVKLKILFFVRKDLIKR